MIKKGLVLGVLIFFTLQQIAWSAPGIPFTDICGLVIQDVFCARNNCQMNRGSLDAITASVKSSAGKITDSSSTSPKRVVQRDKVWSAQTSLRLDDVLFSPYEMSIASKDSPDMAEIKNNLRDSADYFANNPGDSIAAAEVIRGKKDIRLFIDQFSQASVKYKQNEILKDQSMPIRIWSDPGTASLPWSFACFASVCVTLFASMASMQPALTGPAFNIDVLGFHNSLQFSWALTATLLMFTRATQTTNVGTVLGKLFEGIKKNDTLLTYVEYLRIPARIERNSVSEILSIEFLYEKTRTSDSASDEVLTVMVRPEPPI